MPSGAYIMAVAAALARLSAREATCALERAKQETIHAIHRPQGQKNHNLCTRKKTPPICDKTIARILHGYN